MSADDALQRLIGEAMAAALPVPSHLQSFATEAHRLLSVEAELADIDEASLLAPGYRGTGRRVRFVSPSSTIEIEVADRSILGSVEAATSIDGLVLESTEGDRAVEVDAGGMFEIEDVPPGPARFRFRLDGKIIATGWSVLRRRPDAG